MSEDELNPCAEELLTSIEARLGYCFRDKAWLERALTHRSVQGKGERNDYERLEFLGDAVLDLAVAHLLLDNYPDLREGELSKMRAALVNTSSLASIARELGIGPCIRLSRGEITSGGADRPSILADVIEAVFGAIYREGGYEEAKSCVTKLFIERIKTVTPTDPKTELQEILHALGKDAPEYELVETRGPEHAPIFVSAVVVGGERKGLGEGLTKKASQQEAASMALKLYRGTDE